MSSPPIHKPRVVKLVTYVFGLLAFLSIVACRSVAIETPEQSIADVLRAVAANAAFLGILSGTKAGRSVVIVVLSLLALSALSGLFVAIRSFPDTPFMAIGLALISVIILLLGYAYTFGDSTRSYYRVKFGNLSGEVNARDV